MRTCETCRHWGGMPNGGYVAGWAAVCRRVDYGPLRPDRDDFALVLACVPDGLMTGPDFGCVKHDPAAEVVQEDGGA